VIVCHCAVVTDRDVLACIAAGARNVARDGDGELAEFFRKAQAESRKGAEQGKQLLKARLGG
jgi:bacterioferritin-associated ferredoxin